MLFLLVLLAPQDPSAEVRRLGSESVEERAAAAERLKGLGDAAVPALEKAARDSDAEVAGRARQILGVLRVRKSLSENILRRFPGIDERIAAEGDAAAYRCFLEAARIYGDALTRSGLRHADLELLAPGALRGARDPDETDAVCDRIRTLRLYGLAGELLRLLKSESDEVASSAASTLRELQAPSSGPQILGLLEDPEPKVRMRAAQVLRFLSCRGAERPLIALLEDANEGVRHAAIETLGSQGVRSAVPRLAALLGADSVPTRRLALKALVELGSEEAIKPALRGLQDKDPAVREECVRALKDLEAHEHVSALLPCLEDPEQEVRHATRWALFSLKAVEALPEFRRLLRSESGHERRIAIQMIQGMGDRESIGDLVPLVADSQGEVGASASSLLVEWEAVKVLPTLQDLLGRASPESRRIVMDTLASLGGREALRWLEPCLKDPALRATALQSLAASRGHLPPPDLLVPMLKDPDPSVRVAAMEAVADSLTTAALVECGGHPDEPVRRKALEVLGGRADDRTLALPRLLQSVREDTVANRKAAASALADLGAREAIPDLLKLMEVPEAAEDAIHALGKLRAGGSRPALARFLESPVPGLRLAAAVALGKLDGREALPTLRRLLDDPDTEVRDTAARQVMRLTGRESAVQLVPFLDFPSDVVHDADLRLRRLGTLTAVPTLVERLPHDWHPTRRLVCSLLGSLRDRRAVPALIERLDDPDSEVRRAAILALGQIGSEAAAPAIARRLEDDDPATRCRAAETLGELGARERAPEIARLLEDDEAGVRHSAALALRKLGAAVRAEPFIRDLRDRRFFVRAWAAEVLGEFETKAALPGLLALSKDRRSEVRAPCALALGRLGGAEALETVERLAADPDSQVRVAATNALGRIGGARALALLERQLKDGDEWVRHAALAGIAELAPERVSDLAVPLLADSNSSNQSLAAGYLGEAGAVRRIPDLLPLLRDPVVKVRNSAAAALCHLGGHDGAAVLLEGGSGLVTLNALRSQEAYRRFSSKKLGEAPRGHFRVDLRMLSKQFDLPFEYSPGLPASEHCWRAAHDSTTYYWNEMDPLEGLATVLDTDFAAILEEDRIRIVTREEAVAFWRAWLDGKVR